MKNGVLIFATLARGLGAIVFLIVSSRLEAAPYLYLTDSVFGTVNVVDARDDTTVQVIPVGQEPTVATLNLDASPLFVLNRFDGTTSIINTRDLKVTATIPVGPVPSALEVSPDG